MNDAGWLGLAATLLCIQLWTVADVVSCVSVNNETLDRAWRRLQCYLALERRLFRTTHQSAPGTVVGECEDTTGTTDAAGAGVDRTSATESILPAPRVEDQLVRRIRVILDANIEHGYGEAATGGIGRRIGGYTGDRSGAGREARPRWRSTRHRYPGAIVGGRRGKDDHSARGGSAHILRSDYSKVRRTCDCRRFGVVHPYRESASGRAAIQPGDCSGNRRRTNREERARRRTGG